MGKSPVYAIDPGLLEKPVFLLVVILCGHIYGLYFCDNQENQSGHVPQ